MSDGDVPAVKRLSHALKRAWYRCAFVDAWVEERLSGSAVSQTILHRLLPERQLRRSPFASSSTSAAARGLVRILSLIPPEDTGGGSRPAQLAAEMHRRGFSIEWRWVLPIYPWPRLRRPQVPGVDAQHLDDAPTTPDPAELVLVEAPHPRLVRAALDGAHHGPVVYDAIDAWDGALGAGWYERDAEDRLIAEAEHLAASSELLREELHARSGRAVELLPNAVDPALFTRPTTPPTKRLEGTPAVVYVGALWGEWVDLSLIERIARAHPAATIHLVGPAGDRVLPRASNIVIHGAQPRERIPALLAAADVAIVPFTPNRLTAAVSPLKVFEYLAMEVPVVSTALPDLEGVPGVATANDAESFVQAVGSARAAPFPRDAVRAFLAEHTWDRRVDRLLEITRRVRR